MLDDRLRLDAAGRQQLFDKRAGVFHLIPEGLRPEVRKAGSVRAVDDQLPSQCHAANCIRYLAPMLAIASLLDLLLPKEEIGLRMRPQMPLSSGLQKVPRMAVAHMDQQIATRVDSTCRDEL
jgi:hypothetical protein